MPLPMEICGSNLSRGEDYLREGEVPWIDIDIPLFSVESWFSRSFVVIFMSGRPSVLKGFLKKRKTLAIGEPSSSI